MAAKTLWNLNAAVLLVAIAGIGSCARGSAMSRCRIGDLTASSNPEGSKLSQGLGPWVKRVRECDVGEYRIDVPAEGGHAEIMVSRNGHALFLSAGETTIVMDSSGRRVLFDAVLAEGVGAPSISYATYVRSTDAWVENVDLGADGTVDYRTTETAGGPTKREFSVDQRWLEMVRRGDREGVVLDGEFMTVAAARERLAAKRKPEADR